MNRDATMLPMPISAEQHLTGLDHARWVERGLMARKNYSLICSSFLIIHLHSPISFEYNLDGLLPFNLVYPRLFVRPSTYLAREHSPGLIKIRLNSIAVQDSSVPYATLICWQTHHPHNLASTTIQLQRNSRSNHNHAITSTSSSSSLFHLAFVVNSPLISSS